ncbi:MAG: phospho-N-acetylmuramoyl-pentapeptide-transferase [Alphaproteobacteria bacterium]|nr:phospho-N-acetylmuramoyl-pentapeptide-transferase [Alphaproteobacteria bacterium]
MLYHLLVPLADEHQFFNLFRYISFRTAWGLVTALAIAYVLYPRFIVWMRQQKMNQIIRAEGPQSHIENKVGTPTMGGVVMLIGITVSTLLWARLDQPVVWMALSILLVHGLIGFIDDWKKVMQKSSDGLAGRWKLVGQFGSGAVVLGAAYHFGILQPDLHLPFVKDWVIRFDELVPAAPWLGWIYVFFGMFVISSFSNAVNLTDGLDGLAIGPVMTSAGTLAVLAYIAGNANLSTYLFVPGIEGAGELTVFCAAIVGAGLAFLWFNAYPAQIFMGDVGSLALGGALGVLGVITKHEVLLALVGGVFVLENVSVLLQVASFKLTGKRIFKMAPLHHHYEKLGWSEPKIIVRFWIISILLALVALTTLKVR